jgi:hypothetical protein
MTSFVSDLSSVSPMSAQPVFLLAAPWFVWNGHFDQSGIESWMQIRFPEVFAVLQT